VNKHNDGGPAHPHGQQIIRVDTYLGRESDVSDEFYPGMSLRDYFAGQALAGMRAKPYFDQSAEKTADLAYADADAMIAARDR